MKHLAALVTGGSRGIGEAISQKLEASSIRVFSPSRSELDLSSSSSIETFLAAFREPVDILVNNAGINLLADCNDSTNEVFQQTLQINLLAPLQLIRSIAPSMAQRRFGRIVNISSIWSTITKPRRLPYTTSKSALNGLTRAIAIEFAPYNVLVNAVAPGYVNTELTRQNNSPEEIDTIRKNIPIQRLAEPSEIAEVVEFLCSARNTYICGQVLFVDGGYTCQ
ncbi:MAG: SDR family oxidoreductase [bacterium]